MASPITRYFPCLVRRNLLGTGKFVNLALKQDEDEHSIEMQFPYIAKIMEA